MAKNQGNDAVLLLEEQIEALERAKRMSAESMNGVKIL